MAAERRPESHAAAEVRRKALATTYPLRPSMAPPRAARPETPSKPSSVDVGYAVTVIAGPRYVGRQGKVVRFDGASVESLQYAYEVQLDGGELWHFTAAQLRRTPRLPEPPPPAPAPGLRPARPAPIPKCPEVEVAAAMERPAPHGRMQPPDRPCGLPRPPRLPASPLCVIVTRFGPPEPPTPRSRPPPKDSPPALPHPPGVPGRPAALATPAPSPTPTHPWLPIADRPLALPDPPSLPHRVPYFIVRPPYDSSGLRPVSHIT